MAAANHSPLGAACCVNVRARRKTWRGVTGMEGRREA